MGGVPLARGDVVMVFSPNSIAWPVMLFGGWAGGFRMTLTNSSYTPREVAHQWQDSRAKAVVVHPVLLPVVLETFKLLDMDFGEAQRRIIVADWGMEPLQAGSQDYIRMSDLLGRGALQEEEKFPGEQTHETALLCYSSGTTGKPKGVEVRECHCSLEVVHILNTLSSDNSPEPYIRRRHQRCHMAGRCRVQDAWCPPVLPCLRYAS